MGEDRVCKTMEMLRSGMNRLEEEWELGETRMLEAFRSEKHRLNQIATGIFTEAEGMLKDPSPTPDPKYVELCFSTKISQPLLTGDEIKGDGVDCLQVVLRDSSTRNIVDIGPLASNNKLYDIFGNSQGMLYSEGQFFAANMLSENEKVDADNLLSSAFENSENVEPFDDLNSLQQNLAAAVASFEPSNSCIPGHPDTNRDTGASEMMDGSNNIEVPDPLFTQGGVVVSDMPCLARCDSFGIQDGSNNIEVLDPSFTQGAVDVSDMPRFTHYDLFGLEDLNYMPEYPLQIRERCASVTHFDSEFSHGYGVQQQYSIDEMNTDARLDGVGSSSAGAYPSRKKKKT